jgi:hypothetical protein
MNIQVPDNVRQFLSKLNAQGLPLPMIQDCLTKSPSMTYTLTLAAAVMVALSVCHVGNIDWDRAVTFLQIVGGGYLARQTMKHIAPLGEDDKEGK